MTTFHHLVRDGEGWRCGVCARAWKGKPRSPCPGSPEAQRQHATAEAQSLLQRSDTLILDTETTGFSARDEILEIAAISPQRVVLLHQTICPSVPIHPSAQSVHGWTEARLFGQPAFPAVYAQLAPLLRGRCVIAYNAAFDRRMLQQSCAAYALPMPAIAEWVDLASLYKAYMASSTLLKLPQAQHGADADCRAALDLLARIAGVRLAAAPAAPSASQRSAPPAAVERPPAPAAVAASASTPTAPTPPAQAAPTPSPVAPLAPGLPDAPPLRPQLAAGAPALAATYRPHHLAAAPPIPTFDLAEIARALWGVLVGVPLCLTVQTSAHGWGWLTQPLTWLMAALLSLLAGALWLIRDMPDADAGALASEDLRPAGRMISWAGVSAGLLAVAVRLVAVLGGASSAHPTQAAALAQPLVPIFVATSMPWPTITPAPTAAPAWCGPVPVRAGPLNVRQAPGPARGSASSTPMRS